MPDGVHRPGHGRGGVHAPAVRELGIAPDGMP